MKPETPHIVTSSSDKSQATTKTGKAKTQRSAKSAKSAKSVKTSKTVTTSKSAKSAKSAKKSVQKRSKHSKRSKRKSTRAVEVSGGTLFGQNDAWSKSPISIIVKDQAKDLEERAKSVHRADLLPALFRVRGQPYSLEDYPQFRTMYDSEYVQDSIWMCGRQIGKSINASRSEVLDLSSCPNLQILYVAPLQQQTHRYASLYLNEAIHSCVPARLLQNPNLEGVISDSRILKTLQHQSFANGAGIQLTYAKTSSDRARGIFADRIDFDEIQDQLTDNIPIISESLTASSWGIRRFTGTAKTTDNTIEQLFQQSSMCEWVMKCSGCNTWNIPNEDGKVLDMIQVEGLCCHKCGKLLNTRTGEWVPMFPDRMSSFRGYHIPQVVVPAIVEDNDKWIKLITKLLKLPIATFMQEVLGISYSTGSRIITMADIARQSVLPTVAELQKRLNRYVFTVSGVDWGGAEQTSFTVHTIIGVKVDGTIDTIYARRFVGFNPDEVLSEIARAHRFYGCTIMAADYGMGFDKNVMLQERFGIPIIQIMLCRQNRLLGYSPTLGQHRWTVDKTSALEILFLSIKYGKIFFPPVEEFDIYTKDLLSPYEQVSESGGLTTRFFNRDPSRPDDFCMALCFATMVAMKLNNASIVDMIPDGAFDTGVSGIPTDVAVDPIDLLTNI